MKIFSVAILILLESFLQSGGHYDKGGKLNSRNPYFIGILSAIIISKVKIILKKMSQSLFYWNPFCNNPTEQGVGTQIGVAILILLESFLQ